MEPKRTYFKNGQIKSEVWKNEVGQYHRLDGPAFREWNTNGWLQVDVWYINDIKYDTEAEFQVAVDLYKANEIAELF